MRVDITQYNYLCNNIILIDLFETKNYITGEFLKLFRNKLEYYQLFTKYHVNFVKKCPENVHKLLPGEYNSRTWVFYFSLFFLFMQFCDVYNMYEHFFVRLHLCAVFHIHIQQFFFIVLIFTFQYMYIEDIISRIQKCNK